MDTIIREARIGLRTLCKSPGFLIISVFTLAIGIAAETTVYTFADALLLRPLPYAEAGSLITFRAVDSGSKAAVPFSYDSWLHLKHDKIGALQNLSAYEACRFTMTDAGEPKVASALASSSELFSVLRIRPILGRTLTAADDAANGASAMVSESLWRKSFGRSTMVLGQLVHLDDTAFTIVGVFPDGIRIPGMATAPEIWVPLKASPTIQQLQATLKEKWRQIGFLQVAGRLTAPSKSHIADIQVNSHWRVVSRTPSSSYSLWKTSLPSLIAAH